MALRLLAAEPATQPGILASYGERGEELLAGEEVQIPGFTRARTRQMAGKIRHLALAHGVMMVPG